MSKNDVDAGLVLKTSLKQVARDSSGVAAVRFALVVPFMVLLTVGIMDLGMLLMKQKAPWPKQNGSSASPTK